MNGFIVPYAAVFFNGFMADKKAALHSGAGRLENGSCIGVKNMVIDK